MMYDKSKCAHPAFIVFITNFIFSIVFQYTSFLFSIHVVLFVVAICRFSFWSIFNLNLKKTNEIKSVALTFFGTFCRMAVKNRVKWIFTHLPTKKNQKFTVYHVDVLDFVSILMYSFLITITSNQSTISYSQKK